MKVGLIGLGRMGEGMSRRMMKEEIEVWGYRRNYEKAQEAYENGCAPKIYLRRTNKKVLKLVELKILKEFALDLE